MIRIKLLWRALRNVLRVLAVITVAAYAVICQIWLFAVMRAVHYNDFGKFYYSAQQWRTNGMMYGPSPATLIPVGPGRAEHFWNMNPPHFHALILPLTQLSIGDAYVIWTAFNVSVAVLSIIAFARVLPIRWPASTWATNTVLLLASAPVMTWAVTGQVTGLLIGVVTYVWLRLRHDHWSGAAVAVGLLCGVKPFFGPLGLYFLIRRHWRSAFLAAASFLGVFVLGIAVFGLSSYREWLLALGDAHWVGAVMNASVYGLVGRAWTMDIESVSVLSRALGAAVALTLLAVGIQAMRRSQDPDRAITIALLTSLLASPLGWVYYVPVVLGPILTLWSKHLIDWRWKIALAGLWVPYFLLFPYPSRVFAMTAGSIYAWSLLVLWALAVAPTFRKVRRDGMFLTRASSTRTVQ